jgi:hypothetical protein
MIKNQKFQSALFVSKKYPEFLFELRDPYLVAFSYRERLLNVFSQRPSSDFVALLKLFKEWGLNMPTDGTLAVIPFQYIEEPKTDRNWIQFLSLLRFVCENDIIVPMSYLEYCIARCPIRDGLYDLLRMSFEKHKFIFVGPSKQEGRLKRAASRRVLDQDPDILSLANQIDHAFKLDVINVKS